MLIVTEYRYTQELNWKTEAKAREYDFSNDIARKPLLFGLHIVVVLGLASLSSGPSVWDVPSIIFFFNLLTEWADI